jgi:hypothetical protein
MGMDIYGNAPRSETGRYFRNNVWWWRPLWEYCENVAADIIPADNLGHSNDGWGLDDAGALALAERLRYATEQGHTRAYAGLYRARLSSLSPEPCDICGATGHRANPPQTGPGTLVCNACHGKGAVPHFATHYPFSEENVQEFAAFLRECGGFRIC